MHLFYQSELPENTFLDLEESKHCIKVMRKSEGDTIQIVDGRGKLYQATITEASHKKCQFKIDEVITEAENTSYRHIAIAPTKNIDRIEWFIEKAVEIGIDEISLLLCDHSERSVVKMERLEKKAISAMKQSLKFTLPKINELIKFSDFINKDLSGYYKAIAYVDFENPIQFKDQLKLQNNVICLIGPEGDFSQTEISLAMERGFEKVALGQSRLRTETAGIVSCHLMNI